MEHGDLVDKTARLLMMRLPPCIEFDDLVQVGHLGALDAQQRYEPTVAQFNTYATYRIRGAMVDYLRSVDPLTRDQRRKAGREQIALTAAPGLDPRHDYEADEMPQDAAHAFEAEIIEPVEVELPGTPRRLQRAIAELTANEQYVIRAEFWQDANQIDTSRALGVTPSRVCQLRKQALTKLRSSMDGVL